MTIVGRAIDCVTQLTAEQAQSIKESGFDAVGIYLDRTTRGTLQNILQAGLQAFSIWETNPTNASFFSYAKGVSEAQAAVYKAKILGMPAGKPILFTVDYDCQPNDIPAILEYFKGVAKAIAPYTFGDYGGFRAVTSHLAPINWETVGWSYGKTAPGIIMYQKQVDTIVDGIRVDISDIYDDVALWPTKEAKPLYPPIKVTITVPTTRPFAAIAAQVHENGDPQPATYLLYTILDEFHIPYTNHGNGIFTINGKDYHVVVQDDTSYVPYYSLGIEPTRQDDAWNFTAH